MHTHESTCPLVINPDHGIVVYYACLSGMSQSEAACRICTRQNVCAAVPMPSAPSATCSRVATSIKLIAASVLTAFSWVQRLDQQNKLLSTTLWCRADERNLSLDLTSVSVHLFPACSCTSCLFMSHEVYSLKYSVRIYCFVLKNKGCVNRYPNMQQLPPFRVQDR